MILLSVDIQSGKAALFSFPRNLCTATDGSCGDGTRYPDWLQPQAARGGHFVRGRPGGVSNGRLHCRRKRVPGHEL